ncbi:beta-N-acetylhexosaminidase [Desulfobacca acetoxidans]|uniref:beta-N-acetylhexosaminidase n=1 Tax=Desulfobacca acetoxidans (strain ATCC 700848 / DSM 11109 / ASRB2) TaxID=880072 RepID=F2NEH6_DESAR|nr:beta-N-acetylhexosaminidase [Desulfobacca acetoxidans]AEB08166.1 glycoside hydrolase family 3 domain protein [Desulfobacca acetoxidans DSM 11109]
MTKPWGQMLMVGIPGLHLDEVARTLIRDLQVGGIILFKRNISHPQQVAELIDACQQTALAASGYPLLVAVDQEGGPVQRFRHPWLETPSARQMGAAGDLAAIEHSAQRVAQELQLMGVNVNLAPVLDVARNPDCPLWERSYSADPEAVVRCGLAAVRGYLAGGVLPVVKHFPGLGATRLDSHLDLPTVEGGTDAGNEDLFPFREAITAGIPAVMCAHLLVPSWDSNLPTSLSPVAVTRILRQHLKFFGLIFSDDLEMGAITRKWPVPEAARRAVAAGIDIILICEQIENVKKTLAALSQSPELESRLRSAWQRIQQYKKTLPQLRLNLEAIQARFASGH